MKILFDAYTPPDVLLFESFYKEMIKTDNVHFLTLPFSENIELLKQKKIPNTVIGKHGGKSLIKKAYRNIERAIKVMFYMIKNRPDVCISRSPSVIFPAWFLKIPRVIIHDNEKSVLTGRLSMPFANRIILPEAITKDDIRHIFCNLKKVYRYNGIEEMIYLSDFRPNSNILKEIGIKNRNKPLVVMRPEQEMAQYFKGHTGILKPIIKSLKNESTIVFLPRSQEQREEYRKEFGNDIIIPEKAIDAPSLMYYADFFIGAHGTMSREAWVLGTSVISMYEGDTLAVEKYLINNNEDYNHTIDTNKAIALYHKLKGKKSKIRANNRLKKEIINEILSVCKR